MDIEITGNYPIILDGETVGEITVAREGLFWSFEAKCEPQKELVRLCVYGGGKEGYLGIMEPFGDILRLTKKFSRTALRDFPEQITHGGQKGELDEIPDVFDSVRPAPDETAEYSGEFPHSYYNKPNPEPAIPPENDKPPPVSYNSPQFESTEIIWHPCALPCSLFVGADAKRLCSCITGAFSARVDDNVLLAAPEEIALQLPQEGPIFFTGEVLFDDEIYLVCKIVQGRCVSEF